MNIPSLVLLRMLVAALMLVSMLLGAGAAHAQRTPGGPVGAPPPPAAEVFNNAVFQDQSVPSTMVAGGIYDVSVTMRNTGSERWTALGNYKLGSLSPHNNLTWGIGRVGMGDSAVDYWGLKRFSFQVTAPPVPGTYTFEWGMLQEGVQWFGTSSPVAVTVTPPPPVNDATVLAVSAPAQMVPGQAYSILVSVKNTGNTTWTPAAYRLGSQNPQDNYTWLKETNRVGLSSPVAPGQQYQFSFDVVAPAAGNYAMQWRMLQEYVEWFGATSNTPVTVSAAPATPLTTVDVQRSPATMKVGERFTLTWNTTNTTSLKRVCSASGTGFQVDEDLPTSGSSSGTASAAWVDYPSACTWTATGTGGSVQHVETMATMTAASGAVTYIHTDGLGSPIARTDASGKVVSRTRYEPYGYVAAGDTPTIGFTGHVNDSDTGLTYMQQRYYDPVAGRFLSIDPVTTDADTGSGFNRYSYANNNPYRFIDPDGRQAAEKFVEQHRKDMESGNGKVYEPLQPTAIAVTAGMAIIPAAIATGSMVATAAAVKAVDKGVKIAKQVIERKSAGRDGAQSRQIIEKRDGQMNSRTHEVTKDGEVIHQHQNHTGKHGGERQFPDEWTGSKTTNAPYENISPSFGPDKIPGGGTRY